MESNKNNKPEEDIIKLFGRRQLKQQLQQIHNSRRQKYLVRLFLLIGFGLIVFVLGLFWLLGESSSNQSTNIPIARLEQIFDENFSVYPIQNLRSIDSINSTLQNALNAYNRSAFQESISILDTLNNSGSSIQLYLSNALLETGQFEKAIPILEQLAQSEVHPIEGKWYLALALIHQNRTKEAHPYLNFLSKRSNPYQEQAQNILGLIE